MYIRVVVQHNCTFAHILTPLPLKLGILNHFICFQSVGLLLILLQNTLIIHNYVYDCVFG